MNVFIPVTDEMLNGSHADQGMLVPFNTEFLKARDPSDKESFKPADWISKNDYAAARKRLSENRAA